MRVVLIHPPARSEFDKHWARFPVLGLAYVAASLRANGHEVVLLDGKLEQLTFAEICGQAASAKPDLVGITAMTVEFPQAAAIAQEIKNLVQVPIAVGGAHINAVAAEALRECSAFDFACVGEGEHLVNELADAVSGRRPYATIAGLSYGTTAVYGRIRRGCIPRHMTTCRFRHGICSDSETKYPFLRTVAALISATSAATTPDSRRGTAAPRTC